MSNMLRDGMAWLAGKMKTHAGETVVIVRGVLSVSLTATPGTTLLKLDDGYGGSRIEWTDADWLITAADYVLGGTATEPQRGDRIRRTVGGVIYVYEVSAPGAEPVWRWSDSYQTTYRIHAKHISTEAV